MNYQQKVNELLKQADRLDYSETKIMLLEEAIRLADSYQDTVLGFKARKELMDAANFSGNAIKSMVAFSWCLSMCDKYPEKFNVRKLLWQYKWMIESIPKFPQINKQKAEEMLEEMKRCYKKYGYSLRPYYYIQQKIAIDAGDENKAREFHEKIKNAPRDSMSDCKACETDYEVNYCIFMGENEKALKEAAPLLENKLSCVEVPAMTYAHLLMPLIEMKKYDQAKLFHKKGHQMVCKNKDFIGQIGDHILFLSLLKIEDALKLFQEHLRWALNTLELNKRFKFSLSCWVLMERLLKEKREYLVLRLPLEFPIYQEKGKYPVTELKKWFEKDTREIAKKFDERNGTARYKELIEEKLCYIDHGKLPL